MNLLGKIWLPGGMIAEVDEIQKYQNSRCPLCDGHYLTGSTCEDVFESLLALEFSNSEYGAVHFLTVACMMIQHKAYSDAGMDWIYTQLSQYLVGDQTISQIREQNRNIVDSGQRKWKVIRDFEEKELSKITWSRTIQDVAMSYEDASDYRELVNDWAKTVVQEMEPWLFEPGVKPNGF